MSSKVTFCVHYCACNRITGLLYPRERELILAHSLEAGRWRQMGSFQDHHMASHGKRHCTMVYISVFVFLSPSPCKANHSYHFPQVSGLSPIIRLLLFSQHLMMGIKFQHIRLLETFKLYSKQSTFFNTFLPWGFSINRELQTTSIIHRLKLKYINI